MDPWIEGGGEIKRVGGGTVCLTISTSIENHPRRRASPSIEGGRTSWFFQCEANMQHMYVSLFTNLPLQFDYMA